jgi:hypothetical protein
MSSRERIAGGSSEMGSRALGRVRAALAAAIVTLCVAAPSASGIQPGPGAPLAQFNDTVRTASRQVAALHVTEDEDGFELTWVVGALPCAGESFRLDATEGQIASTQASNREIEIQIVAARLSGGVHCGAKLPSSANEGHARLTVKPVERELATASPVNVYGDSETTVASFSVCVTLASDCEGVYVLRGYIEAPRLHARVEYRFKATPTSGPAAEESTYEALQPLPAVIERLEQCPVPSRVR